MNDPASMSIDEYAATVPARDLSPAQERRLNRLYLCGDLSGGPWPPVQVLLAKGYIEERGGRLTLTARGRHYCHHHSRHMPL